MLHFPLKHSTAAQTQIRQKNEAYRARLSFREEKIKGTVGVCVFLSPAEVPVSDTPDSSTIKTTHFKGSEDEAGDLRELKDRRRNSAPFSFLFLFSSPDVAVVNAPEKRENEEGEETGEERRKESSQG